MDLTSITFPNMNKKQLLLLCFLAYMPLAFGQALQSPTEFLGYQPGQRFTPIHRVQAYFEYLASQSASVKLEPYGESLEKRPLYLLYLTAPENMANLEQIRMNNLIATGLASGTPQGKQLPIIWFSYNIHGNETVGTESALSVVHGLLTGAHPNAEKWLKEMVIVVDPCENPDGHARYVDWYHQKVGKIQNPLPEAWEHIEPWPGGRYNHYVFDLNRDWAWQTQHESQVRTAAYHRWMPQVHVDFHEMGVNSPYFFGPSAEPFHEVITPWQREFHKLSGINNAKHFDKERWLYFTGEVFDLFYPSYGDTWPTYNGAIGFTFEQGGSGRAGLGVLTETGDTLTFFDRISHNVASSFGTLETSYQQRERLVSEFKKYFSDAVNNPKGTYKSYLIKHSNDPHAVQAFLDMLKKQQIRYGHPGSAPRVRTLQGFNYQTQKETTVSIDENDIVVSIFQPQSVMATVLLEPRSKLADSVTYDLTAWALPYVYNLEVYALRERIEPGTQVSFPVAKVEKPEEKAYAWYLPWKDVAHVKFLTALHKSGIKVRYAQEAFTTEGKSFQEGTMVVTAADNRHYPGDLDLAITRLANTLGLAPVPAKTGLVATGKDLGSSKVVFIEAPSIAIMAGDGVNPTAFGEAWHYFDAELEYPVTVLHTSYASRVDLSRFQVLVLPSGYYDNMQDKLIDFVRQGGKVIALQNAISVFSSSKATSLGTILQDEGQKKLDFNKESLLRKYGDQERTSLSSGVEGSIYKLYLDKTHPISFGVGEHVFTVKTNSTTYPYVNSRGWNVGVFKADSHVAGFAGYQFKEKVKNTMGLATEQVGRGQVVYMSDSPIFRGFWHSGKLLFANAVFLTW
jgi:hypothetical protein